MPTRSRRRGPAQGEDAALPGRRPGRTAADWLVADKDAFDVWLRRILHHAHDGIATEPVPEAMLRLIEEDGARRARGRRKPKRGG